ncbi:unnamed protein product [Pylaiella littoralis]
MLSSAVVARRCCSVGTARVAGLPREPTAAAAAAAATCLAAGQQQQPRRGFAAGTPRIAGDPRWLALRKLLRKCDTPSLCDADKNLSSKVIDYAIRPRHMRSKGITLLGLARTVRTVGGAGEHPDFRNLVESLMESSPGEVLVVDCGGSKIAVAGEMFSAEAKRRSLAGMLIEGACRDTETIARLRFPVYTRFVNPMAGKCITLDRDMMQVPVTVGGVEINSGDVIMGDDDGVVVLGNDLDKIQETALLASDILRNERAVLTEVIDNKRCLMEFMDMMDSHKKVAPDTA